MKVVSGRERQVGMTNLKEKKSCKYLSAFDSLLPLLMDCLLTLIDHQTQVDQNLTDAFTTAKRTPQPH